MASLTDRLKQYIRGLRGQAEDYQGHLERLGVNVIRDERLAKRLEAYREVLQEINKAQEEGKPLDSMDEEELKKTMEELHHRLLLIDEAIRMVAVAWGRPGDRGHYAEMLFHWNKLLGWWQTDYGAILEAGEKIEAKRRLASMLISFAKRDILPYARMVIDASFLDKDVSPQHVIVVQQQQIMSYTPIPQRDLGSLKYGAREEDRYPDRLPP